MRPEILLREGEMVLAKVFSGFCGLFSFCYSQLMVVHREKAPIRATYLKGQETYIKRTGGRWHFYAKPKCTQYKKRGEGSSLVCLRAFHINVTDQLDHFGFLAVGPSSFTAFISIPPRERDPPPDERNWASSPRSSFCHQANRNQKWRMLPSASRRPSQAPFDI